MYALFPKRRKGRALCRFDKHRNDRFVKKMGEKHRGWCVLPAECWLETSAGARVPLATSVASCGVRELVVRTPRTAASKSMDSRFSTFLWQPMFECCILNRLEGSQTGSRVF